MKLKLIAVIAFCLFFINSYSQDQTISVKPDIIWDTVGISANSLYFIKTSYETKSRDFILDKSYDCADESERQSNYACNY